MTTLQAARSGPAGALSPQQWAERTGIPIALVHFADDRDRTPIITATVLHTEDGQRRYCSLVARWAGTDVRTEVTAPGHPAYPAGPTATLHGALPDGPGTAEPDIWDSHLSIDGSTAPAWDRQAAGLVARATTRHGWHILVVTEAEDEQPNQVPRLTLVLPPHRTTAGPGSIAHHPDEEDPGHQAGADELEPTCGSPAPCASNWPHSDDWAREHLAALQVPPAQLAGLAPRMLEVLKLAADGHTDVQIGAQLYLSPNTVKTHLTRAYALLGAASRTGAILLAIASGIIRIDTIRPGPVVGPPQLTGHQISVLLLMACDLPGTDIASRLGISVDTVKSHTREIFQRLGAQRRHRAVVLAVRAGLLPVPGTAAASAPSTRQPCPTVELPVPTSVRSHQ